MGPQASETVLGLPGAGGCEGPHRSCPWELELGGGVLGVQPLFPPAPALPSGVRAWPADMGVGTWRGAPVVCARSSEVCAPPGTDQLFMQGRRTCGVKSLHLFTHPFTEQTPAGLLPGVAGPWNAALGGTDSSLILGKQEVTLEKTPLGPCPQRGPRLPRSSPASPQPQTAYGVFRPRGVGVGVSSRGLLEVGRHCPGTGHLRARVEA